MIIIRKINKLEKDTAINRSYIYILLCILLIILFFVDLITGPVGISPGDFVRALSGKGDQEIIKILFDFRLPRALTALLAGMALSVSGLQMQTVFQNPLAGPYVLGISSGASLGVAILILGLSSVISSNISMLFNSWAIVGAAWLGSGLVLVLIMIVSLRVRDIMTVLILGIMFASAVSAIVSIMQYFSNESMLKSFVIWTMGSLGNLSWKQLNILIICVLPGLTLSVFTTKMLNALLLGEEHAISLGLRIKTARTLIFISTSILAGSVTAFCGPLAFIGIAVPHICRLIFATSSHNYLIPGTILSGGIILLASDIVSQLPGQGKILPVNSVTALIGIPVLIWIIVKRNKFIRLS
ncbi:MAG TPA: iron ABC transporter permease [Bacteroidetes bacterium]|nr:iron ABC transporter permease [Bacteroidota bacterium]